MATHDIARETWADFFEDFSRRRQGTPVTIEAVDPRADDEHDRQVEERGLPLVGISYEAKGSEAGAIEIMTGTAPEDHVTHTITNPKDVYHKTGAGVMSLEVDPDEVLEITSSDYPPVTYLRFRRPENG
jgi:hypothetical protein